MNERFHKIFMLLCVVGMGAVMFIAFNVTGSSTTPAETGGTTFNPLFLMLLLCPLLHLFMMRGHGGSCHKKGEDNAAECHNEKKTN